MKRIIFNLKREWYNAIASGEKDIEYRRICKHWAVRLGMVWPIPDSCIALLNKGVCLPIGWYAAFRLGYSRKHPDIVRPITMIDIGSCPYEGWDGKHFRIYFERSET